MWKTSLSQLGLSVSAFLTAKRRQLNKCAIKFYTVRLWTGYKYSGLTIILTTVVLYWTMFLFIVSSFFSFLLDHVYIVSSSIVP